MSRYAGVVVTSREWFNAAVQGNVSVYHFPPNRNPKVHKLSKGSVCLIYVTREKAFVGDFTVEEVARVSASEFSSKYSSMAVEVAKAPFPKDRERCWVIKFSNLISYEKPVKLEECRDIRTSTSNKPLSEWVLLGFLLIKPGDADNVVSAIRSKATLSRHDDLVRVVKELGEALNFIVKLDEPTPDGTFRLDVTWRDAELHRPLKVFEVVVSSDVDRALVRLQHAYDVWGASQLWLVVGDEKDSERVKRLVDPKLKGSFARIRGVLHVITGNELYDLYEGIKDRKGLLKELAKWS